MPVYTAKGYCAAADVAGYLGQTLAAAQTAQATALVPMAERFAENATRRAWLTPPVTAERYTLLRPVAFLKQAPVASVELVQTRSTALGDPLYTAIAGTDYELQDGATGRLAFSPGYAGRRGDRIALVSYTPNQPVPPDLSLACAMLVAHWLTYQIDPQRYGVASYNLAREVDVKVSPQQAVRLIPADVQAILDGYTLPAWA